MSANLTGSHTLDSSRVVLSLPLEPCFLSFGLPVPAGPEAVCGHLACVSLLQFHWLVPEE